MKKVIIFIFILILSQSVFSQKIKRREFRENAELRAKVNTLFNEMYIQNSDIGYLTFPYSELGAPRYYMLTGHIIPHYYVFPKHWRVGLVISPQVKVRVISDKSYPVRTPSYIPGGTMYFKLSLDTIRYKYLSLAVFHHSNGQDGPPLNADGTINTYNGNFGTNYAEFALNIGSKKNKGNRYFKIGLEAHSGLLEWGDEPAYRDKFAKMRINVKYSGSDYASRLIQKVKNRAFGQNTQIETEELWRTVIEGMYIADSDLNELDWYRKFNAELKVYRKIRHSENTSWFFSLGYIGFDNYNIYFEDHYPVFRFGLAAGNSFFRRKSYKKIKTELEPLE